MSDSAPPRGTTRTRWLLALKFLMFAAGVALLVALLARSDTAAMWKSMRSVGGWFTAGFAAYAATTVFATLSWRALLKRDQRPSFLRIFAAQWCGESVNFLLPAGAPGEIAKGAFLSSRVDAGELAISLTIYNWISGLVIFAAVATGAGYALLATDLPTTVSSLSLGIALALTAVTVGLRFTIRRKALQPVLKQVSRLPLVRLDTRAAAERVQELDERIAALWREDRRRLVRAVGFDVLSRTCAFLEVLLLLYGLMPDRDLTFLIGLTLAVEAASQVLLYAALVVPGQIGAMEGGTAAVFAMLGLGGWLGLALELLRRGRKLLAILIALALWATLRPKR